MKNVKMTIIKLQIGWIPYWQTKFDKTNRRKGENTGTEIKWLNFKIKYSYSRPENRFKKTKKKKKKILQYVVYLNRHDILKTIWKIKN